MGVRISILFEIEPGHVRIYAVNVMPVCVMPCCALTCDRADSTPVDSLLTCVTKFGRDCVVEDITFGSHPQLGKVGSRDIQEVFVSGGMESQQKTIMNIIHTQFGIGPLNGMSLGVDTESLGAYGAAHWASYSSKHEYLRNLDSWNVSMFRTKYENWYNGTRVSSRDEDPHGRGMGKISWSDS